ncbi:hypothetical protein K431DRAFT_281282 [Polychaeton citri CBS 116435]|uniref:Dynein light intermediate chain n=1 Tax=Polychaeton citri CBS 116435 TaxID=1314669 RepID=A0A9P4QDN3_9PEZI|nr:hypothetical protein K431DRAFT_281282 [Polychaeton citri CBS 116435]
MATMTTTGPRTRQTIREDGGPVKRKKEERKDIWSSLLRQTREAQARNSSSQSLAHRSIILCGSGADDQKTLLDSLARPPPPSPPGRRGDRQDTVKDAKKGQVKLSNRYAYGYGHVTLFSPPGGASSGVGALAGLGQEAEEVARIECHTFPEARGEFEETLRRLLTTKKADEVEVNIDEMTGQPKQKETGADEAESSGLTPKQNAPAICVLLNWNSPWDFLAELRAWYQLIARALLPAGAKDEDPVEALKEFAVKVSVVVQHTEAQEAHERDGWKEDRFDFVSQNLRTVLLPLNGALVYTSSAAPPQQPGSPLSDVQKVIFTSLGIDLASLSPSPSRTPGTAPARKEDLLPKHNVVDRMAICVPAGWDSAGKIRLLSETFSPEEALTAWQNDLDTLAPSLHRRIMEEPGRQSSQNVFSASGQAQTDADPSMSTDSNPTKELRQQEEVYGTTSPSASPALQPTTDVQSPPLPPSSPSELTTSALTNYNAHIIDPHAHRTPLAPSINISYTAEQSFLTEMKSHLDSLTSQDVEKARVNPASSRPATSTTGVGRMAGTPSGDTSGALDALGDVSFNVGGVNYNTAGAEAAIANLKRPAQRTTGDGGSGLSSPRTGTPRPPGRDRERSTPGVSGAKKDEVPVEELEKYFASLMKKSGGSGSQSSTPTRH